MAIYKESIGAHGAECNALELSVDYALGGINWYNGHNEGRGYYLYCTPVTYTEREYNGQTYRSVSQILGQGSKMLLKEVGRRSSNAEAEAVELAKTKKDELIKFVCEKYNITLI